jgi:hypothetical protein
MPIWKPTMTVANNHAPWKDSLNLYITLYMAFHRRRPKRILRERSFIILVIQVKASNALLSIEFVALERLLQ